MYWPDNSTSAGAAPSVPAVISGVASYFTSGVPAVTPPTVVDDWWLNTVLAELAAIATIDGATLDKANNDQCAEVLQPIRAIKGAVADTTATSSTFKGALVASTTSRANNASGALVAACTFGTATGAGSAVIAATGTIASSALASGANSAVVASYGASAANKIEAAGDRSAVIASKATSAGAVITHAHSEASAAVACLEGTSGLSVNGLGNAALACKGGFVQTSTSTACAIIASQDCAAGDTGITGAAVLASGDGSAAAGNFSLVAASSAGSYASGSRSAVLASMNSDASAAQTAVIASYDAQASVTHAVVIASGETGFQVGTRQARSILAASRRSEVGLGSGAGHSMLVCSERAELIDSNTLALGYHATTTPTYDGITNKNLTIKFDGLNGNGYFDGGADIGTADYAELFEVAGGAPIPPGRLIALDDDGRAKIAAPGEDVIGVSTSAPSLLGNAAPLGWSGQYMVDEWGVPLREDVTETLDDGSTRTRFVRKEDPKYDPSRAYVPRKERPGAWVAVGLVGQLRLAVDDRVKPGAYVAADSNGIATSAGKSARPGASVRVMGITSPFDAARGHAIAMAFVR